LATEHQRGVSEVIFCVTNDESPKTIKYTLYS